LFPEVVTPLKRTLTLNIALLLTFACESSVFAAEAETPWEALRHLPKRHVYTVLNRDGTCVTGEFISVTDSGFVVKKDQELLLPKPNIVRISAGEMADVHTTVYSARSSWADVQALQSPPYYSNLRLVTADARQFAGALIGVTSDQLILTVDGKEMRFSKEFLARVFLAGKKPAYEESGLHWSPKDLSRKVISPMQPIPLYEASARQDDSKVECSPSYLRRPQ